MNILCIDTAFQTANLVLHTSSKNTMKKIEGRHSETTLLEIEKMLIENNLSPQDIDVICVNVGPGSFTGIRVGIALVKGFSVVNKKLKFIKVNSMELIAKEFNSKNDFYTILNALGGRYFVAKFVNGEMVENPNLKSEIPDGETVGVISENLENVKYKIDISCNSFYNLCKEKIETEKFCSSCELIPMYLRLSQAEENLQGVKIENLSQKFINDVYEISKKEFGSSSWSLKMFEEELIRPDRFSYCITDNGNVVSFINVLVCEGEQGKEYNVLNVASKEKRKGYATQLLELVKDKAKKQGIKNVWLEVDDKNTPALCLYQKLGFKKIAVRKKYYKNGDDALILRYEI